MAGEGQTLLISHYLQWGLFRFVLHTVPASLCADGACPQLFGSLLSDCKSDIRILFKTVLFVTT